jgi:pimeloyl-ACP methyl ester carboxylesterase
MPDPQRASAVPPAGAGELPAPRWVDVDGIRTRYFELGAGRPVVFIYGGNFGSPDSASSAPIWAPNMIPLSAGFRVIAFDKLGQGHTDNPKTDDDYTMAAVVRHAAGFLKALGLTDVNLVGHSRGGYAAARLTLENQHLVRTLTIVNSGTLSPRVGTNDVVLSAGPHPSFSRESAQWIYERYCFRKASVTADWIDASYEVLSLPKYRASVRKMEDEHLKTRLFFPRLARDKRETMAWLAEGRLQRPTQIFWGLNDRTANVEGALDLMSTVAAHERRTTLHVFNEAGHFPYREHPERFNAQLARFISLHAA